MKWIVPALTVFGALVVASPASANSYSGRINYKRSFTASESGECWNFGDGKETVSENWQIAFSHAKVVTGAKPVLVRAQITGLMHEHVACPPNNGYPSYYDVSVSDPGTLGVRMKSRKRGQLTFLGMDSTYGLGLRGTAFAHTIGGPGGNKTSAEISPEIGEDGDPVLTVPTKGVTGRSFVIPWDEQVGTADPTNTEPGTVSVSLSVECTVPKLKGDTIKQARSALRKHGCTLGEVHKAFSRHIKRGHVISQSPAAGVIKPPGAAVNITVSKGKK